MPKRYFNTLLLFNSVPFGLRGYDEHRKMYRGDVNPIKAADVTEYFEYLERQT